MDSLYLLIPIALVFVAIAIRMLFWAINSGQYDNLDTEAHRILFNDDEPSSTVEIKENGQKTRVNQATAHVLNPTTHPSSPIVERDDD